MVPATKQSSASRSMIARLSEAVCVLCEKWTGLRAIFMQTSAALWMSMLLSAFAGVLAVTVVVATFYFIRWRSPCLLETLGGFKIRV